eukprot:15472759-Alexandrium_andersonii.AAC.1
MELIKALRAFGPSSARPRMKTSKLAPEALKGAVCIVVRADTETAVEIGRRARQRCFSGGRAWGPGSPREDL